jgi:hypothetical protein
MAGNTEQSLLTARDDAPSVPIVDTLAVKIHTRARFPVVLLNGIYIKEHFKIECYWGGTCNVRLTYTEKYPIGPQTYSYIYGREQMCKSRHILTSFTYTYTPLLMVVNGINAVMHNHSHVPNFQLLRLIRFSILCTIIDRHPSCNIYPPEVTDVVISYLEQNNNRFVNNMIPQDMLKEIGELQIVKSALEQPL